MSLPNEYWGSYEETVSDLAEFLEAVQNISAFGAATGARFVWRGAARADWPLHSSLVRVYLKRFGNFPDELGLQDFEAKVISEAREWGLDWHAGGGRLTPLELLAALQHYGAPTRMLDFTFNPLIGLWFAVEKRDADDGRVFAVDISTRLIGREQASNPEPWWWFEEFRSADPWISESWIWKPPPFEPRIVRQEGCFLMGGIPSTSPLRNAEIAGLRRPMRTDEIHECMSVPFRLINYKQAKVAAEGGRLRGGKPTARSFTLRVTNKPFVRSQLEQAFGFSHRSLFPDFPGYAERGSSFRTKGRLAVAEELLDEFLDLFKETPASSDFFKRVRAALDDG